MPKLEIAGFDGEIPRQSATMLAGNQAQRAENVKMYSRELRQWRGPTLNYTAALTGISSIYKMISADDAELWLTWAGDVDVVPGPLADDNGDIRVYYTGDGTPKKTTYALASAGAGPFPGSYRDMGVPQPQAAPAVTIDSTSKSTYVLQIDSSVAANDSGGIAADLNIADETAATATEGTASWELSGTTHTLRLTDGVTARNLVGRITKTVTSPNPRTFPTQSGASSSSRFQNISTSSIETRAYVYTYVSAFGTLVEESAPSPPSPLIDVDVGQAVTVSGFEPTPGGSHGIYARRIYRTITGATTDTYEFVTEMLLADTTFTDSLTTQRLGEVMTSTNFIPPPHDLSGLVSHPCGSLAGFVNNTLYFSEPYLPHAWPYGYALNFPYDIVGLGVFGSTIVVATERYPYVVSGPVPGAMSSERIPIVEPCIAKRSIASDGSGVVYASPNGLVAIGANGAGLATESLYRRQEWELENPASLVGHVHDNKYFGARPGSSTMVLSRSDIPALSFLDMDAKAFFVDATTADLYFVADDDDIYKADDDELRPLNFLWLSKRFALDHGETFSAIMIDAAYDEMSSDDRFNADIDTLLALNAATWAGSTTQPGPLYGCLGGEELNGFSLNGSAMRDIPTVASTRSVSVTIYVDDELVQSLTPLSIQPLRLKSFRGRVLEVQLEGNVPVRSLTLASTIPELR